MEGAIDHLVYATSDLQRGVEQIKDLLGVTAMAGGSHPGMGTRNALLALGPTSYLEIIGPDPEQTQFVGTRIFGIDSLQGDQLVHWCVRRENLSAFANNTPVGEVMAMSRADPLGHLLEWQLAFPENFGMDCALPFFIDWGVSRHPASGSPQGALLTHFEIRHPQAMEANEQLAQFGLEASAVPASEPGLCALIQCPRGEVELV